MKNEQAAMIKKNVKYTITLALLVAACFLTGCSISFDPPEQSAPVEAGYGRLTIGFTGGQERTVYPSKTFDNYAYTFTRDGGSPQDITPAGGLFTLETGAWTVEVKAYVGVVDAANLAASGTAAFTITEDFTTNVTVILHANETTGSGTFTFAIQFPAGANVETLTLQKLPDLTPNVTLNPAPETASVSGSATNVPAGFYLLTVKLSSGGKQAGLTEAVHIKDKLSTEYTFDFTDDKFYIPAVVTIAAIGGVAAPATGGSPATAITETAQYTGAVTWSDNPVVFAASTTYTATITLTAKTGFTLQGVAADFFTVEGATPVNNPANSGVVTAVFPATAVPIDSPTQGLQFQFIPDSFSYRVIGIGTATDSAINIPSTHNDGNNGEHPVTEIGASAFANADLTGITIPENITTIGAGAFTGCNNLTNITINTDKVTSYNGSAFTNTNNWRTIFPAEGLSVTFNADIGDYAFSGNPDTTKLTSVTIGSGVTSIGERAFFQCAGIISITLPSSLTSIGSRAFYGCKGITDITIPASVTSFDEGAFYQSGLISITLPNTLTSISNSAFYQCSSLASITIPASVMTIGQQAFYGCTNLIGVAFEGNGITGTNFGTNAFPQGSGSGDNLKTAYQNPANGGAGTYTRVSGGDTWTKQSVQTSTPAAADYTFGNLEQVAGSVTAVTITRRTDIPTSTGAVSNIRYNNSPTLPTAAGIYAVTFDVVAATGWNAASGLSAGTLIVVVPTFNDIAEFSAWLDAQPSNLPSAPYTVKLNVSDLGGIANMLTSSGKNISLDLSGSDIDSIGANAFRNCTNLTGISIPENVASIGTDAFTGCNNLTDITINTDKVTSINGATIPENTFNMGLQLATIFPADGLSVTFNANIGNMAFFKCDRLTSITIAEGVTRIGSSAFEQCANLASVSIAASVTTIVSLAFYNCDSLVSVTFEGTIPSSEFSNASGFPGDLRAKFYATDTANGTPGTYTRASTSATAWTKQTP